MTITRDDYIKAKKIWNDMKFLSTQKEMTEEERKALRESYKVVAEYEVEDNDPNQANDMEDANGDMIEISDN